MRSTSLALGCILFVIAPAGGSAQTAQPARVSVCVRNEGVVPIDNLSQAEVTAATIFERARVDIEWRCRKPHAGKLISVEVVPNSDRSGRHPMAYALPYEGVHIRVFYDHIEQFPNRAAVLAYTFVHEITHILQGTARHSSTGIMKARWTATDIDKMDCQHLSFTPVDVTLIQKGLAARATMDSSTASATLQPAMLQPSSPDDEP
ncbi:MAG TPA: hypothetical protein VF146_05205 [Bryobacteraceae bacterium]